MIRLAHGVTPVVPATLWADWSIEPLTLLILIASLLIYDTGVRVLWSRAGRGHGVRVWQTIAFKGGLLAVLIALISPLDALSAVLFSAHMVQHMVLIFVAAPLFVVSGAPLGLLWGLPLRWRRAIGGWWNHTALLHRLWAWLTWPIVAWIIYGVALWAWHWPLFYQGALANATIHALEHLSFIGTSALFWYVLIAPGHRSWKERTGSAARYGIGVLSIATTGLHSSILGALLVFSTQAWYPAYAANVVPWGLTPLADQQLAGLIMWVPIGVVYISAIAILIALWLRALEESMQRREHLARPESLKQPL